MLVPNDYTNLNSAALITIQTMKTIGFKIDAQSMDSATIVSRRTQKNAPDKSVWSASATITVASSVDPPLSNFMLSASCRPDIPGWPCDANQHQLRTELHPA